MAPSTLRSFSHWLLFSVLCFLSSGAAALAAPVKFNIPAQPAPDALKLFSKQSGTQVMFVADEVKAVRTNEVIGDFEPMAALTQLLQGTGYTATERKAGWFAVVREKTAADTGSVRGSLVGEGGKGLPDALVAIRETAQSASTDQYGQYVFPKVAAGTYVLVANAAGYQPLHITDVNVKAGRDLRLGKEEMRKPLDEVTKLDPYVVQAESIMELARFGVTGQRTKPFADGNVDISRTINDTQAYYIFDARTIEEAGAVNVEEFLKQRLTMNTTAQTNSQISGSNTFGNTSTIDLRGLGFDKTLILVNGRRMAGLSIGNVDRQPDLNGIPLAAVDRVEIMPSSASGIYGGSAMGGVVNLILKKDYTGGEIRANYDNTWGTDAPRRTVSATYGMGLEGGKTHVLVTAQWSDAEPLLLQDRRDIFEANLRGIVTRGPTFINSGTNPFGGATPNITATTGSATTLTLKNGTVIPSRNTYVPAGTSPTTPSATLAAGLIANGGNWNLDLPVSTLAPTGLLQPFGVSPKNKSLVASLRRQMWPNLEAFADFSYLGNHSTSVNNAFNGLITVPAAAAINPFNQNVNVKITDGTVTLFTADSVTHEFTAGLRAKLPHGWTGEFDYTWSENRYKYDYIDFDAFADLTPDVLSGALNPFVDTARYPLNLAKYRYPVHFENASILHDFAVRGSGPLAALPWGTPQLTVGLERRATRNPESSQLQALPVTTSFSSRITYYRREQTTDSGYGELQIPLVREDRVPLLHSLEFQAAGRLERFTVDSGTAVKQDFFNFPFVSYQGPTLNGQHYFATTKYDANSHTLGLKYQPVRDLTFRVSQATAFLPPTPVQLFRNPQPDVNPATILDPHTNTSYAVTTISGGSPDLKPQNAKSVNAGLIWEPQSGRLDGLRVAVEYYRIEQFGAIATVGAQTIVDNEDIYAGRVTRNAAGTITLVDVSNVNLFKRDTVGWDFNLDYRLNTAAGAFSLHAIETVIRNLQTQYAAAKPAYEAAGFSPAESGAPKTKSSVTVNWERHQWSAGWTARYVSSYKQDGAAGGPRSVQFFNGAPSPFYLNAQGSDTIPSQLYHDVFAAYTFVRGAESALTSRFRRAGRGLLDGVTLQFGVKNVFDTVPPLDARYNNNYYLSPYGDTRLRSYWFTVKKAF